MYDCTVAVRTQGIYRTYKMRRDTARAAMLRFGRTERLEGKESVRVYRYGGARIGYYYQYYISYYVYVKVYVSCIEYRVSSLFGCESIAVEVSYPHPVSIIQRTRMCTRILGVRPMCEALFARNS